MSAISVFLVAPARAGMPEDLVLRSEASDVALTDQGGLRRVAWTQRVEAVGAASPSAPPMLAAAPEVGLSSPAGTMAGHGKVTVGLSHAANPVWMLDESVRGSSLYPALWVRKGSGGVAQTFAAGDPTPAAWMVPGDEYRVATTELSWPAITAPLPPAGSDGIPMVTATAGQTRPVDFDTALGSRSGRVTTFLGHLRASGGVVDGTSTPVEAPPVSLALPPMDASRSTLTFLVTTMPAGSGVESDFEISGPPANPILTVTMRVRGVLPASDSVSQSEGLAFTNTASFFVAVVQDAIGDPTLAGIAPAVVSTVIDAPPDSAVAWGQRSLIERTRISADGRFALTAALDDGPLPSGVDHWGCVADLEREADVDSLAGQPVSVRSGHVGLGNLAVNGQSLASVGSLAAGVAVVDGSATSLRHANADLVVSSERPPWAVPVSAGPLSAAFTADTYDVLVPNCKLSDRAAQVEPYQNGYGSAGGNVVRAVWDLDDVVVEASLIAASNVRLHEGAASFLVRMRAVSRDGLPHRVGLSAALTDADAIAVAKLPPILEEGSQPDVPIPVETAFPEGHLGYLPFELVVGHRRFEVSAIGEPAPPDGTIIAGRYAGPSTASLTNRRNSLSGAGTPSPALALTSPLDVRVATGVGNGLTAPSLYSGLLLRVFETG